MAVHVRPIAEALREGTTLRVRLVVGDGERRTYVFSVIGFDRAYDWLEGACPTCGGCQSG